MTDFAALYRKADAYMDHELNDLVAEAEEEVKRLRGWLMRIRHLAANAERDIINCEVEEFCDEALAGTTPPEEEWPDGQ